MSVRFNSGEDRLVRTTNLPVWNNYTVFLFAQMPVAWTGYNTMFALEGAAYNTLETENDILNLFYTTGQLSLGSITAGTWYAIAITHDGTTVKAYIKPADQTGTMTLTSAGDASAQTFGLFMLGNNSWGEFGNVRMRSVRIWDAVLTATELEAERLQLTPVRTANLNAHYALDTIANKLTDSSGLARDLNAPGAGPWETEADPSLPAGAVTGTVAVTTSASLAASGKTVVTGISALTPSATIAAAGKTAVPGTVAITTAVTSAASGKTVVPGTVAVTTSSTVTAIGGGNIGTAAVTTTVTAAASGGTIVPGTAALAPAATVAASGTTKVTGTVAVATTVAVSASTSSVTRHAFTQLPLHHSQPIINAWSNGEPRIMKDCTPGKAGELFGFGWSDTLVLFKSPDLGASWSLVDATAAEVIGNINILCATQDSAGKVHLLFRGVGGVLYARIALSYTGSAITGFSSEVKDVAISGSYNTNSDIRGELQVVTDQGGTERLMFMVNDNPSAGMQIQMGRATSLAPTTTSNFVKLDGTAGATVVLNTTSFNNHDHSSWFAQLGSTRDIWVFWAPIDAEFGAPDSTFTTRLKLTTSGASTWSVGTPITMVGSDATSSPEGLCVVGTQNYVWFMYYDPVDGLCFDKVNSAGTYTHNAIPSPDTTAHMNGWGAFSISSDETKAYAVWNGLARNTAGLATAQAYYNGSSWTVYQDTVIGDSWGMGGSVGWDFGVAATTLDATTARISIATINGPIPADVGTVAVATTVAASIAGTSLVQGSAAVSTGVTVALSGQPVIAGTTAASTTVGVSSSGTPQVTGTVAVSPSATVALAGTLLVPGTVALTPSVTGALSGTSFVTGNVAVTPSATVAAVGSGVVPSGGVSVATTVAVAIAGTPLVTGPVGFATATPTLVASGQPVVSGTFAQSIQATASLTGTVVVTGSLAQTIAPTVASVGAPITAGTVAAATSVNAALSGTLVNVGTAAITTSASIDAAGDQSTVNRVNLFPAATVAAQGTLIVAGSASVVAPVTVGLVGTPVVVGAVGISTSASLSSTVLISGSAAVGTTVAASLQGVLGNSGIFGSTTSFAILASGTTKVSGTVAATTLVGLAADGFAEAANDEIFFFTPAPTLGSVGTPVITGSVASIASASMTARGTGVVPTLTGARVLEVYLSNTERDVYLGT